MAHKIIAAATALTLWTSATVAGGIDRSGQPIGLLFEDGEVLQLSFGAVMPSLDGVDVATVATGNVANSYFSPSIGYKRDLNDKLSFAVILDQPFGADVDYPLASPVLGGTKAEANAYALTGVLRYKFDENFSVHGGLRAQRADGNITLSGGAYGAAPPAGVNGYNVALDAAYEFGWLVGAAYEIPEIALRVAITYNSAITHDFDTVETLVVPTATGKTNVELPQSVNIDFQTGIAEDTLLFGSIRWVDWSEFKLRPPQFTSLPGLSDGLISLDDTTTYEIGVGRRFSEKWAGSVAIAYEEAGDPLVSPLSPSTGLFGVTVAGIYTIDQSNEVTLGVNYTKLGDAMPETGTPDVARANFTDNDAWGLGLRYSYKF